MKLFSTTAALILVTAVAALAQNPSSPMYIPFQAQVTDQEGGILEDNQYSVIFNLYDSPVGGEPVWSERHTNIGVTRGMVNVFLGSIKTLQAVDFSTTKYLGITVDVDGVATTAEPEMVPRSLVVPAFYAKRAEEAVNTRTMDNHGWDAVFENGGPDDGGTIPGAKITNESVTTSKLMANSVTTGKLANDAVTAAEIADASVGSEEIVDAAVQNVDLAPGVAAANLADQGLMAVSAAPINLRESIGGGGSSHPSINTLVYRVPSNRYARVTISWYAGGGTATITIGGVAFRSFGGQQVQEFTLGPNQAIEIPPNGQNITTLQFAGVLLSNGLVP